MFSILHKRYFWEIQSSSFNLIYALFTFIAYNIPFMILTYDVFQALGIVVAVNAVFFMVFYLILCILFMPKITKPLAITFCIINAGAIYFMSAYGVVIDKIMLMNVLQTDMYEVADLLNIKLVLYILGLGLIPSYLIYKTEIIYPSLKERFKNKLFLSFVGLCIVSGLLFESIPNSRDIFNRNKYIKNSFIPINYIGAVNSVVKIKLKYKNKKLRKISEDAKMLPQKQNSKPNLLVMIVGESARHANFSLGGYNRPTNKPLEQFGNKLIYFNNFYSCGTATAISVPCMFSPYGRENFKPESERYTENVLDIIQHAGYKLLWRENNTDCKDNCNRMEQERFCHVKECPDEILLNNFAQKVQSTDKQTLVVLHQRGSHGPLYKLRYPEAYNLYQPICHEEFLQDCSHEELINVYDNTVYYTSYMLAETIKELESLSDKYNTAMFFTSDHGESLGEEGIYLHSAPYDIAPDEQKHIPSMLWMSDGYIKENNIDMECVQKLRSQPFSHDNVFHTLLGMSNVSSSYYKKELDILAMCRR